MPIHLGKHDIIPLIRGYYMTPKPMRPTMKGLYQKGIQMKSIGPTGRVKVIDTEAKWDALFDNFDPNLLDYKVWNDLFSPGSHLSMTVAHSLKNVPGFTCTVIMHNFNRDRVKRVEVISSQHPKAHVIWADPAKDERG